MACSKLIRETFSGLRIYLCADQLLRIRIVDIEGLPFGTVVHGCPARFAMPVAGVFDAAEGQLDLRAAGRKVDIDDACLQLLHGAERPVDIAGVEREGETVLRGIGGGE